MRIREIFKKNLVGDQKNFQYDDKLYFSLHQNHGRLITKSDSK